MKAEITIAPIIPNPPPLKLVSIIGMTLDEADTLMEITAHVGGDPSRRRGHVDAIRKALAQAGVSSYSPARHEISSSSKSIIFV